MDAETFMDYYKCVPVLQAREALILLKSCAYPHVKTNAAKGIVKDFQKAAFPVIENRFTPKKDIDDLDSALARALRGR